MSIIQTKDIINTMFNLKQNDKKILQTIILMVVLYAWISLLSALFGIFYPVAIWITWLGICLILYKKNILVFVRPSAEFLIYILIAVSFALFIAFFTVPTIFSGRDQGSISEASMRLANNHTLIQHSPESDTFFDIYGRGKALNFPGFFFVADGGLITQFPLPYITFLSGFFGIFNVYGFIVANAILLFTFIMSILSVARYYINHKYTLVFALVLLSSFSISWFAKFTLSENIASALLWSSFILYLFFKDTPSKITYFIFLSTISLLLFTRIEGIWFFIIFVSLVLYKSSLRSFIKQDLWWLVFFPITILFVVTCSILIMNMPFFLTLAKASSSATSEMINPLNFLDKITHLFLIYTLYGLMLPLLFTLIAIFRAFFSKKYRTILLPIVLVLPLMIYYIFPNISGDHPWMLRRFVFALLPATILISIAFISHIHSNDLLTKTLKYTMISLLCIANIPAFASFIFYAENTTLNNQVLQISQKFNDTDLILIDENAAGNGWSMITSPLNSLYHKHAVYFFNPNDLQKIDTKPFDRVMLITSDQNELRYKNILSDNMQYIDEYTFKLNQLNISKEKLPVLQFPQKEKKVIHGKIYEITK